MIFNKRWFGIITQQAIRRGSFTKVKTHEVCSLHGGKSNVRIGAQKAPGDNVASFVIIDGSTVTEHLPARNGE